MPADSGEEGRKKSKRRERTAQAARDAVRYTVEVVRFAKNLVDVIGFIDRHL